MNYLKDYDIAFINYLENKYDLIKEEYKSVFEEISDDIVVGKFTIKNICAALGIEVPLYLKNVEDENQRIRFRAKSVKNGDVCFIFRSPEEFESKALTTKTEYELAIRNGAKLIIIGEESFKNAGLNQEDFPVILVDRVDIRVLRLFYLIKKTQSSKIVMVTGSVGKTTTKELCANVSKHTLNTYYNSKNSNTVHQTAQHAFNNWGKNYDVYIQECGAGYKGSVRLAASILQPDILILTNVYKHHLQAYGSFERLLADKVSADDYLSNDGVIITNYDEEILKNYNFKHRVISFSIYDETADYRAVNIRQDQDDILFDIIEKGNVVVTNIKVKLFGEHNVYNVLAAYVMGRILGISIENIKMALSEYRTEGIRQNFINIGGVYLNVDCYNVAEESILAMLKAGETFKLNPNNKKIAFLGGENKLGYDIEKRSMAFGEQLAGLAIDKIIFCGAKDRSEATLNRYGDALSMRSGYDLIKNDNSALVTNIKTIVKQIKKNVNKGDLVMFKGIYYLNMPIAIDKSFGTSFSFSLQHYKQKIKHIKAKLYDINLIEPFGEVEIVKGKVKNDKAIIPTRIRGYKVFRTGSGCFKNNASIKKVKFGRTIKNIGEKSFYNCINLKECSIPKNVKVIEKEAFAKCNGLNRVYLANGITHIGASAFFKCTNLKEINIPTSVGQIETDAFNGCTSISIICEANSYAHHFAKENNIDYILK